MKKLSKNSPKKYNPLVLVVILAMMIFAQQTYLNPPDSFSENIEDSSQQANDEESRPLTVFDIDQNLIASNIQLNVNHIFYEIMAIEHDEVMDHFGEVGTTKSPDDYHKILFRQVISPNAP